jgi:hypothetical protein
MTTKLVIELPNNKTAIAYISDSARVLVGNQIKALNETDSISVLNQVDLTVDNSLRTVNNIIVPIKSIEKVEGVVVGYIDPEKTRKIASQVISVFIPKLGIPSTSKELGYSMYFATIVECDITI